MTSFDVLAESRRQWINDVLVPWCGQAERQQLIKAEIDWVNLAGQVAPKATLWQWAWGRFPALVHDGLPGLSETNEVRLVTKSGEVLVGYPDDRESDHGRVVLLMQNPAGGFAHSAPVSIDDVVSVEYSQPEDVVKPCSLPDRPLTRLPEFDPDARV